jgi:predicted protein tyrosine phosphatase
MKVMQSSLSEDGQTSSLISPRDTPSVPRIMSPDTIFVSPLSLVETTIEDAQVSHLVTLINGETLVPTPPSVTPDRHLRLDMNDICEPIMGLVLPCEEHVADLVQFALDWDRRAPLLIHCWAGSVESARVCLDAGLYISFAGSVTFKNAVNLQEVARYVPAERLLVETDSPYLAPVPVRGRRNDPRNVAHILDCLSALRGESREVLERQTLQNGCRLFGVEPPADD